MNRFTEGEEVEALFFADDSVLRKHVAIEGLGRIDSIRVVMESGQMAEVPWFEVCYSGGRRLKWNGAAVEGVELALNTPPQEEAE